MLRCAKKSEFADEMGNVMGNLSTGVIKF